jgi:hypothetical protein
MKSPDAISEITEKSLKTKDTSKSRSTSKTGKTGKRKVQDDDEGSNIDENHENSSKKTKIDDEIIQFNREERKYVKMKVRSGDTITSPCWTSKLCQVATLTKEGLELMKSKKCKYFWVFNVNATYISTHNVPVQNKYPGLQKIQEKKRVPFVLFVSPTKKFH